MEENRTICHKFGCPFVQYTFSLTPIWLVKHSALQFRGFSGKCLLQVILNYSFINIIKKIDSSLNSIQGSNQVQDSQDIQDRHCHKWLHITIVQIYSTGFWQWCKILRPSNSEDCWSYISTNSHVFMSYWLINYAQRQLFHFLSHK
jgi:hypothetical protein